MRKTALITGITGQDGSHVTELLLEKGYMFTGVSIGTSTHFDERYVRPTEGDSLIGDPSKAKTELGWQAQVLPPQLGALMTRAEAIAVG